MKRNIKKRSNGGTTKRKHASNDRSSKKSPQQTKRRHKKSNKSTPTQIHSVYIVAHGCHLKARFNLPHDTALHFNQKLNLKYCGDATTIEYDISKYPHKLDNNSNDYFLDFVDKDSELFNSFGVYLNNQLVGNYRNRQNVLLSEVVGYLRHLEPNGILNIYCGICRTKCDADDELLYEQMKQSYVDEFDDGLLDTLANL
jgi:hypothetical protein